MKQIKLNIKDKGHTIYTYTYTYTYIYICIYMFVNIYIVYTPCHTQTYFLTIESVWALIY